MVLNSFQGVFKEWAELIVSPDLSISFNIFDALHYSFPNLILATVCNLLDNLYLGLLCGQGSSSKPNFVIVYKGFLVRDEDAHTLKQVVRILIRKGIFPF